jgi:hypothetical protein
VQRLTRQLERAGPRRAVRRYQFSAPCTPDRTGQAPTLRERARRLKVPAYIVRRQAALERLIVRLMKVAPNRWH